MIDYTSKLGKNEVGNALKQEEQPPRTKEKDISLKAKLWSIMLKLFAKIIIKSKDSFKKFTQRDHTEPDLLQLLLFHHKLKLTVVSVSWVNLELSTQTNQSLKHQVLAVCLLPQERLPDLISCLSFFGFAVPEVDDQ